MDVKSYKFFLDDSIKNIKEALNNKNMTVFAGSGISIDSGVPLWGDLISKIKVSLNTQETDYLKVAELFHIQFKDNIYYQKISEYFPKDSQPNLIHKKIVRLNVKNIITTNWDELLENAINEQGEFFEIIKSDEDIGYSNGYSKLIKMHGSIEQRNIVFKESDYLNYSANFPLVENFIKSTFSTDTVLILGYSLSDINIQQVISWVNFQSKHIKPIYFLKVDSVFDYLEFEYYKSKNIFVLYWGCEEGVDEEIESLCNLSSKGKMTHSFLNKISAKASNIDALSFREIFNELYESFKIFDNYRYILPQTFVDIIKKKFNLYGINELFYKSEALVSQNEKLNKFIIAIIKINNKFVMDFIDGLLVKISVKEIKNIRDQVLYTKTQDSDIKLENHLYDFNFSAIEKELTEISFTKSRDVSRLDSKLRQAYLLYQNREFIRSYGALCDIAKKSFKHRRYDIWYIAQFNKKQFCNLLRFDNNYLEDNEYKRQVEHYCIEIANIDLQDDVNKLPLKYRELLRPLNDFVSFIDRRLLATINFVGEFESDLNITTKGGVSYNDNIKNVIQVWSEIELFINSYSLTIEYDNKIRFIFENIFKSVFVNNKLRKNNEVSYFLFSMGVRSFNSYKDLSAFLFKYYKESVLTLEAGCNKFIEGLENLTDKLKSTEGFLSTWPRNYYHSYFVFSSYLSLTKQQFNFLLDSFNTLLNQNKCTIIEYDVMNTLLVNQFNKNKEIIENSELEKILEGYIDFFIKGKFSFYMLMAPSHTQTFESIFTILKEIEPDYCFKNFDRIESFFTAIKKLHSGNKFQIARVFLLGLWSVSDEITRNLITVFLSTLVVEAELNDYERLELQYLIYANKVNPSLDAEFEENLKALKDNQTESLDVESFKMNRLIRGIDTQLELNKSP